MTPGNVVFKIPKHGSAALLQLLIVMPLSDLDCREPGHFVDILNRIAKIDQVAHKRIAEIVGNGVDTYLRCSG